MFPKFSTKPKILTKEQIFENIKVNKVRCLYAWLRDRSDIHLQHSDRDRLKSAPNPCLDLFQRDVDNNTKSDLNSAVVKIIYGDMAPSIGLNLRVTGYCNQGGRKYMEDVFRLENKPKNFVILCNLTLFFYTALPTSKPRMKKT